MHSLAIDVKSLLWPYRYEKETRKLKCEGWKKTQHVQGAELVGRYPNPIRR